MLRARTLKIFALLVAAFIVLGAPAYVGPAFLEEPSSYVVIVPVMSLYFFQHIGIPGLVEHNGLCGWGLCGPTPFGVAFVVAFWLGIAWLVAWAIARFAGRRSPA